MRAVDIVAMHIPDGYLGPQTYVLLWVVMIPIWAVAARKVKRSLRARQVPLLALGAAFSFVLMMFNVPVVGGSTGHAVGATLIAVILGPWEAVIAVSIALVIQAGLFGDGGITSLGANCFNMAVVTPFVGYYLFRLLAGDAPSGRRRVLGAGAAAYVALVASAVVAGVEFGLQPYLNHTASGQPLYAPYGLGVAVPVMALEHLFVFGWIEALVTMGVVAALARSDPALLEMKPAARPLRWLWAVLAVAILLTPLGALAPGTAWGEWSPAQLQDMIGYVPADFARVGAVWKAAMPGYLTPGVGNALLGYLGAAVVGVLVTVGIALAIGAVLARPRGGKAAAGRGGVMSPPAVAPVRPGGRAARPGRSLARKGADAVAGAVADVIRNEDVAARPGLLQRLDARSKLLTLVVFAVTATLVHSVWVLIALVAVTVVLAAVSRVGVRSFERKVWATAGLFAFLIALPSALAVFTPGPAALTVGPLTLTEPGLLGVVTLVARVVAAAGFALLVVWTMRWSDLLRALTSLRMPDVVVATLAMTHKQILSLLTVVEQIHLARESRTLTRGAARADRAWVTERMAFVARTSMKRADDVHDAMLSRGFTGAMPSLARPRLAARDWLWLTATLLLCVAVVWADRVMGP
jgi:cobalt/nickel transport system permease protein